MSDSTSESNEEPERSIKSKTQRTISKNQIQNSIFVENIYADQVHTGTGNNYAGTGNI